MYEYCIIGGGLAGLYTAYKLEQREPNAKIILLERNRQLGGRIDTVGGVEAGAGRFHEQQPLINQLIKELGLKSKPISETDFFIPTGTHTLYDWSQIRKITDRIVRHPNPPRNKTFLNYAATVVSPSDVKLLVRFYGYTFDKMNAYDTVEMIRRHFSGNQYFILDGGLSQIIHELTKRLTRTIVKTRTRVSDIVYNDGVFTIVSDNQNQFQANRCICAVQAITLQKWPIFKHIYPMLRAIKSLPLCRIYAHVRNIPKHTITTDNDLRMVIPIHDDIVMMSYTDGYRATQWNELWKSKGIAAVNREHKRLLGNTYGVPIPMPTKTQLFYWEHGVAFFSTDFDSGTMPQKIMRPFADMPLFVCGENYSATNYQWMEGALGTSEYILGLLDNIRV